LPLGRPIDVELPKPLIGVMTAQKKNPPSRSQIHRPNYRIVDMRAPGATARFLPQKWLIGREPSSAYGNEQTDIGPDPPNPMGPVFARPWRPHARAAASFAADHPQAHALGQAASEYEPPGKGSR
jgi:hypothetical protein